MKKYRYLLAGILMLAIILGFTQSNRYFFSRDLAINDYITQHFNNDSAQLIEVVETDIKDVYYLLLRTKGSSVINTTSCVSLKKSIFGWQISVSPVAPNVDFGKYLIDAETKSLK